MSKVTEKKKEAPIPEPGLSDRQLLRFATRFVIGFHGPEGKSSVTIERYSNHGTWIEGGFVICSPRGSLNPWYLSKDGVWRYKKAHTWKTAQEAVAFLDQYAALPGTRGWVGETTRIHEPIKSK